MPSLNKIVKVNVNRQTQAIRQQSFSGSLLLSLNPRPSSISGDFNKFNDLPDTSVLNSDTEEYKFISRFFSQNTNPDSIHLGYNLGTDADISASLDRIVEAIGSQNIYLVSVIGDSITDENKKAVATWCASNKKLAILQSTSDEVISSSASDDLASELKSESNERASLWFTENVGDYIDASIMAQFFRPVGSFALLYKELVGVPVSNKINGTSANVLESKNANYYATLGNRNITFGGIVSNSDFIDNIMGEDFLSVRIQEEVVRLFTSMPKIPYTDAGVENINSSVRSVLSQSVGSGILSVFDIATPSVVTIPVNDRANRKFGDILINATLTGSVKEVSFQVNLGV